MIVLSVAEGQIPAVLSIRSLEITTLDAAILLAVRQHFDAIFA